MLAAKSDGAISTKPGRKVTRFEDGSKRIVRTGRHGVKSVRGVSNSARDERRIGKGLTIDRGLMRRRPQTKAKTAGPLRMGHK